MSEPIPYMSTTEASWSIIVLLLLLSVDDDDDGVGEDEMAV